MEYEVKLSSAAQRDLRRLETHLRSRVKSALKNLIADARPIGCKKLRGRTDDVYRIRVGDYRVLYRIDDESHIVLVLRVIHRREAYR
ncbi:type II toxin-antitoxin system RelE family toxin [Haliangium sp.]|uniref:type II toxin-antitoxin system RelE family toxin n=1 Tax=Haliangium sp. TaxID=2663208 RepID=UPI003D150AAF